MKIVNGYMSILQIFAHIHELTVQRKDISRRKVKNSSANIVELQKKKKERKCPARPER